MNAVLAAAALLLSALPFPPPKVIQATDKTRCDWGPVVSVSSAGSELVITTPAGPVTYKAGADLQVLGADGKALAGLAALRAGQNVRVYYVIENGAKAQEVDVQST